MYYTITNGTGDLDLGLPVEDKRRAHEKHCAVCHSYDGIEWFDHRIVLSRRLEVANENIGVAAPFVWQDGDAYRMLYCGIGTRWWYYSISEAVSADGYDWERGGGDGENIALAPNEAAAWESKSVEYPCVIDEDGGKRLFYCGNENGGTGIGTAVAHNEGVKMPSKAILMDARDDVATALVALEKGETVRVSLGDVTVDVVLQEDIRFGHKLALRDIGAGEEILKYGLPIGRATEPVGAGEWVHVDNCRSDRFGFRHEEYGIHA